MSWQNYVDDNLLGTGKVTHGAICGASGGIWAHSPGFTPTDPEIIALANGIKADPSPLSGTGIFINGEKYMFLRHEQNRSAYGKTKTGGVCVVKTTQGIIIGVYGEGIQPGECTLVVENLADYLISSGY